MPRSSSTRMSSSSARTARSRILSWSRRTASSTSAARLAGPSIPSSPGSNMYAKLHKTDTRTILAVCDEDILGKTFREKGLKLEVTEHFFKGDKMDETALWALIRTEEPPSMNLVG